MQVHQEQYNVDHPTAPLRLIFFPETTRHVLHIIRALQQPCGNALVLGPAGVGKRSMCSFAACFGGMACSPLVLPQDAPVADFRRQLKVRRMVVVAKRSVLNESSFINICANCQASGE